jgi:hypothetical protein
VFHNKEFRGLYRSYSVVRVIYVVGCVKGVGVCLECGIEEVRAEF